MKKSVNWEQVIISQAELENLFPSNIFHGWAIDLCRVLILRKKKYFQPLLITEAAILLLEIILLFPLNLIVFRNVGIVSNNSYGLIMIVLLAIAIASLLMLLTNYWLWQKAKRLKTIAILLEKVEDFNYLIETFKTLNDLSYFNNLENSTNNSLSIKMSKEHLHNESSELSLDIAEILLTTRSSLIQSMKMHNTLYRKTSHNRDIYQLFANLENKLVHFLSLPHDNSDREYQQTLAEIINLGLTVHQEVKKREFDKTQY